jgi:hypothetical protein
VLQDLKYYFRSGGTKGSSSSGPTGDHLFKIWPVWAEYRTSSEPSEAFRQLVSGRIVSVYVVPQAPRLRHGVLHTILSRTALDLVLVLVHRFGSVVGPGSSVSGLLARVEVVRLGGQVVECLESGPVPNREAKRAGPGCGYPRLARFLQRHRICQWAALADHRR